MLNNSGSNVCPNLHCKMSTLNVIVWDKLEEANCCDCWHFKYIRSSHNSIVFFLITFHWEFYSLITMQLDESLIMRINLTISNMFNNISIIKIAAGEDVSLNHICLQFSFIQ